jgi:hypothetical protein
MFRPTFSHLTASILQKINCNWMWTSGFHYRQSLAEGLLLSRDQEMIPARNAIDAHVQGFVFNGALLLHITKIIRPLQWLATLCSKCLMFSACIVAEQAVASTNSRPMVLPIATTVPHRTRHAPPPLLVSSRCLRLVAWAKLRFNIALWTYIA